jgi:hypothetical protein
VCAFCVLVLQAYRDKEADFAARQTEYAAVTAERDEVRRGCSISGCSSTRARDACTSMEAHVQNCHMPCSAQTYLATYIVQFRPGVT